MKADLMRTKHEKIRVHILNSAIKVVGRHGYAKATMARIVEEAGVPYGSIYLYFHGHQDILSKLLPMVNDTLRATIRERSGKAKTFMDHEAVSFDVIFEQAPAKFGKQRVFAEAPFFVPQAYDAYLERMAKSYIRLMHKCKQRGEISGVNEEDFGTIAYSLMGAKQFLVRKYIISKSEPCDVPPHVRRTYLGMVEKILLVV